MNIEPIAYIRTDFKEKFGIPRQSGRVKSLTGRIEFVPEYRNPQSLRGILEFSHLWLIFDFSLSHRKKWSPTVRPPRLGGNKRIGVFASRSPFRPNSLGLSCVRLIKTEETENGTVLIVGGADLLDNTPIYDIKPYIPYADCHTDAVGSYADENKNHRLTVVCSEEMLLKLPENKRQAVLDCLADDPRPAYQDEPSRVYAMAFSGFDIRFHVSNGVLTVTEITP